MDLDTALHFLGEVAVASLRPDIAVWSKTTKAVILSELTVPWEDQAE